MQQARGKFVVDREILKIFFYDDHKFSDCDAFLYMLSQAAYLEHVICYKGKYITLKAGDMPTSIRNLMKIFGWSDGKVQRFLQNLKTAGLITTSKDAGFTIITICNYKEMQTFKKEVTTPVNSVSDIQKAKSRTTSTKTNRTNKLKKQNKALLNFKMLDWHLKLENLMGSIHFEQWAIPSTFINGTVYFDDQYKLDWCKNHYYKQFETALDMMGYTLEGFAMRKVAYDAFNKAGGI